jgi:hypothetical protein
MTPKASKKEKKLQDDYQRKMKGVFICREVLRRYSDGHLFSPCAPTRVHRFDNRASCVGYPDGQDNYSTFQRNVHRDVTVVQLSTCVVDSSMCIKHIINPA